MSSQYPDSAYLAEAWRRIASNCSFTRLERFDLHLDTGVSIRV
jgi:hypothetical protein